MAFLVQDDSGSVNAANAYITAAEYRAYHTDRGVEVDGTDAEIQAAIVKATDYMDGRWRFRGEKLRAAQRTAWPRTIPEDDDQLFRSGVPVEVKEACAEYALVAFSGSLNPTPTRDETGQSIHSKTETVGPVSQSVTYAGGGSVATFQRPKYPIPDAKLKGLVEAGGTLARG